METFYAHMEKTLVDLDFLDKDNPKQTMTRLRRLFNRVRMDQMELNIFRGVLTAMQNYIFYTGKVVNRLGLKASMDELREAAKAENSLDSDK